MKTGKIAIGAIIGAGVGIIAGVLTAPKSGRETRDGIRQKSNSLKDKALQTKDEVIFKAEEVSDTIRDKAKDTIDNISKRK